MGEQKITGDLEGAPLREFLRRLLDDVASLEAMLESGQIEEGVRRIGAEQEVFLVDKGWRPAPEALRVLEALNDEHFTTELALFNLEANLDPLLFETDCLRRMETQLDGLLATARETAAHLGVEIVLAGILPTIRKSDLSIENMTPYPRYHTLNRIMGKMRGGPYEIQINGTDELRVKHDNVMFEACNCSFQIHFQVGADEFANLYNVAQLATAPVLAAATNSPLLFGRRLWSETRIALFQQSLDTRGSAHHLRERRPRVSFGTKWVRESVTELFKEDIARFRAILGSPPKTPEQTDVPTLDALRLHNGTVYRWNRPCYGLSDGKPHLRIENRVLPSGPTPRDEIANAAFWFGVISGLSRLEGNIADKIDFDHAAANFKQAARYGMGAQFEWLGGRTISAQSLIVDTLIPLAREGLEAKEIDKADIDDYLGVIAQRVTGRQTGARWMVKSFDGLKGQADRSKQLSVVTAAMVTRQKEGKPVHEWELADVSESGGWKHNYMKVEQYMTTDLFTVNEDEPLDLVAQLIDWEKIRYVPVEDSANRLVGLVSYRAVLRALTKRSRDEPGLPMPVSDVMITDLITVSPETLTLDAILLMRDKGVGFLPVVKKGRLIGVVTEGDYVDLARELLTAALQDESD